MEVSLEKDKIIHTIFDIENMLNEIIIDFDREDSYSVQTHSEEIRELLERISSDNDFMAHMLTDISSVHKEYDLTSDEEAAILSGDIKWIESHIGSLNERQRFWLENRLTAEIW